MTVTQSYSLSLTYTSLRMYLPQTTSAAVPASSESSPPASSGDTVTLSPEATAPPVVDKLPSSGSPEGSGAGTAVPEVQVPTPPVDVTGTPVPSSESPAAPTSRAARRAEVLLEALDADQDGAVTKEEFLDGAMALLRRAGARHHYHKHHRAHDEGHDSRHEGHGMRGLERKLDRLLDRVDDSGDGNVDQAELTDALAKVTREPRPHTTETTTPSSQETPSPAPSQEVYTSVTVVIAVKQYASVAAMKA